jgi:hypothetical protein
MDTFLLIYLKFIVFSQLLNLSLTPKKKVFSQKKVTLWKRGKFVGLFWKERDFIISKVNKSLSHKEWFHFVILYFVPLLKKHDPFASRSGITLISSLSNVWLILSCYSIIHLFSFSSCIVAVLFLHNFQRHKSNLWAPYFICAEKEQDFKEWLTALFRVISKFASSEDNFETDLEKFLQQAYVPTILIVYWFHWFHRFIEFIDLIDSSIH